MEQRYKLDLETPTVLDAEQGYQRIVEYVAAGAALVLLVALLFAGELRLTPEQRLDMFQTSNYMP